MENSLGGGFVVVFAVSGSVVLLAMQLHKRLLSDFMKKIDYEIGPTTGFAKDETKKKVRFAVDVEETSSDSKASRTNHLPRPAIWSRNQEGKISEAIPVNRQVLYKGILRYRAIKGCN
ncbi:hypothetical protein Adt_07867 [Abeliophyllum distichum]|uniref:Uncharacterized protein n=1 Tax=Abeliophyllum distichum TaxID=126358 RepID=A0ABD1VBC6_9LAMI